MKIKVKRDADSVFVGTIKATVGMTFESGVKITKVNEKSISLEGSDWSDKLTDYTIWYTEAIAYGFEKIESHEFELIAAKERKFKEGEWWYHQKGDDVYPNIIEDPIMKAGWEFAKSVQTLRDLALKNL
jgi:hypothetical protein